MDEDRPKRKDGGHRLWVMKDVAPPHNSLLLHSKITIVPLRLINDLGRQLYALEFSAHAPPNKKKCIFIDESGFNLHLRRTQARSKKGTRANDVLPTVRGRWWTRTLILAMNTQGVIHTGIIDDRTCTGPKFCAFVDQLVSKMRGVMDGMDGAWLIMSNARIRKISELRRILEETSYELKFLSPYSYMLNPA
ncbi:unnamed protein product [Heligmosomoides polygyrus]|uniref:DDE_3 domain-containing protein n=1 Tax=Heligmosomoides polygyrus TaxID=6339 RepID=A0A183GHU5_HELPZ|nr:unnamed protein product [Heligmosomoides polygyrus]